MKRHKMNTYKNNDKWQGEKREVRDFSVDGRSQHGPVNSSFLFSIGKFLRIQLCGGPLSLSVQQSPFGNAKCCGGKTRFRY